MNTVEKFWNAFCDEINIAKDTPYEAWSFGNTEEMANNLSILVKEGIKTATTSALELYDEEESLPQIGEYSIILDGSDQPVCVIELIDIFIMPYNQISSDYAYLEGEGDRSYEYWKTVHDDFFSETYEANGKTFYEEAPMVCEIFKKVY